MTTVTSSVELGSDPLGEGALSANGTWGAASSSGVSQAIDAAAVSCSSRRGIGGPVLRDPAACLAERGARGVVATSSPEDFALVSSKSDGPSPTSSSAVRATTAAVRREARLSFFTFFFPTAGQRVMPSSASCCAREGKEERVRHRCSTLSLSIYILRVDRTHLIGPRSLQERDEIALGCCCRRPRNAVW